MLKQDNYKNVPHFELIQENEQITAPSIFMFTSNDELYPFLYACEKHNCTVFFENENLTIPPKYDMRIGTKLMAYSIVASCREIGDAYIRYLGNESLRHFRKE